MKNYDLMVRCRCMGDDSPEAKALRGKRKRLPRHIIGIPGCGWVVVRKP